eukprot:SAG22_NODE_403_length_11012_cov_12.141024_10_plen_124_part_00
MLILQLASHVARRPDEALQAKVAARAAADPATAAGGFGYFFTQHDDYVVLKSKVTEKVSHKALPLPCVSTVFLSKTVPFHAVLHNKVLAGEAAVPDGVASIAVGLETLRLAEYLLPELQRQLS